MRSIIPRQFIAPSAAPTTLTVNSTSRQRVQAEATAKADGAQHNPLENTTTITQPELS